MTTLEKLKRNESVSLKLTAVFDELDKELSEKTSFTERQMNFKKDEDEALIKKFNNKVYSDFNVEILDILLDRFKKKERIYLKTKSVKDREKYMRLKNFFLELSKTRKK